MDPNKLKFHGGFLLTSPLDKFASFSGEETISSTTFPAGASGNRNYADDLTANTSSPQADDTVESTGPRNRADST